MNKIVLVMSLVIGFAWCRVDYVNTTTNGTNILTNMLLDAGYLTNVSSGSGGGTLSATPISYYGNIYTSSNLSIFSCPASGVITNFTVTLGTAHTNGNVLIDLWVGGTTVYDITNNFLTVTNGGSSGYSIPNINSNVVLGDQILIRIVEVGSTFPGTDARLLLYYE